MGYYSRRNKKVSDNQHLAMILQVGMEENSRQ